MAARCALLLVCLAGTALARPAHSPAQQQQELQKLFSAIDTNADQEISAAEAASFAAAALDSSQESWSPQEAAAVGLGAIDGPDEGEGVTAAELRQHLRALLQDHGVVDWVAHGLGLPQYARAFKQNAITALDFPFLLADGGAALAADLGVTSKLHQQQILRGLKRLILGLGKLPDAPVQLSCAAHNKSAVQLSWQAPAERGHPSFHKFVLQRQRVAASSGGGASSGSAGGSGSCAASPVSGMCEVEERWETAGEPDDEDSSWVDLPPAKGSYRYRLAAWSAFGHSPYAVGSAACTVRAAARPQAHPPPALPPAGSLAQPLAPAEMQALLAAVAAAGGNLSAGRAGAGGAAGSTWTWSAASSAAVVALSILLKASQLKIGVALSALWRAGLAAVNRRLWGGASRAVAAGAAAEQAQLSAAPSGGELRRCGSSHASLASRGSEQAAGEEAALQAAPSAGLLSLCSSQQQLLGSCEPSWQHFSRQRLGSLILEGSGLDPAAAAAALQAAAHSANDAVETAEERDLQEAILRGAHCAHPGCHLRFDRLRDMRRRLESHHCALCQRMYCLQHTRVSPHGPRGGCGLESKCVCYACFAELAPAQQAAYERINRLPKGAGATSRSGSGTIAAAAGTAAGPAAAQAGAAAPLLSSKSSEQQLAGAGAQGPVASDAPSGAASPRPSSASQASLSPAQAATASTAARRRWRKAGKLLLALARFKAAGSAPTSPLQQDQ
ncbi:hypothetical protein ABPG75_011183 [Micractinium tetrahymenae]